MIRAGLVGCLAVLLVGVAGLLGACGEDRFVGEWGIDSPMPGTDRLAMTITRDGDVYTVEPTAGIEDAQPVPAKMVGDDLVGMVTIEEMTIELHFMPTDDADTLDLELKGRQEGKPTVSFDFTLQRESP